MNPDTTKPSGDGGRPGAPTVPVLVFLTSAGLAVASAAHGDWAAAVALFTGGCTLAGQLARGGRGDSGA
ncbi:hypothetical protein [Nocardia harenae]|uniref:hypothetical protein n=1 Tax=Nocardia harenae TaxID=358707 RepID=UPI00082DFBFB|nr:hypothetical protein [Nocardia harenae]